MQWVLGVFAVVIVFKVANVAWWLLKGRDNRTAEERDADEQTFSM